MTFSRLANQGWNFWEEFDKREYYETEAIEKFAIEIPEMEDRTKGRALDLVQCGPVDRFDARITGTSDYAAAADSDMVIITAGIPRKPGMSRDDLVQTNVKIVGSVSEQIARVCTTIRNIGRAGIGVLQYQWMLLGGLRTEYSPTGRGGARYSRFDLEVHCARPLRPWTGYAPLPPIPICPTES